VSDVTPTGSCDGLRPLLAGFLTQALEPGEQARVEAHLPECSACSEELVGLLELSEDLASLSEASSEDAGSGQAAPALQVHAGGGWRVALSMIAAALLLLTAWIAWRAPAARVVIAGAEVQRLRPGQALEAREASRVLLPCGSEVEVEAGATLRFLGKRELALDTGVGWFRVAKAEEPFLVRARGARVRVLGTSFRVEVKEIDMSPKQGAALGAAVIVAVATGVVLFETDKGSQELRAGQGAQATTAGAITKLQSEEEVAKRLAPLEEARAALEAENAELKERQRKLEARVAALKEQLRGKPVSAPGAGEVPETSEPDPVPTDQAEESKGFRVHPSDTDQDQALAKVDWSRAGEGAIEMFPHLEAVWQSIKEGKSISPEVQKTLYKANQKLVEVVLEIQGKVPTHTSGNGEFTHPLVLVNVMAEHLSRAGEPFQAEQLQRLEQIGAAYQAGWDQVQGRYGEATPALRKLSDELVLKRDAMAKVEEFLTPAQREIVIFKEAQHVNRLDIYSPIMAVIANAKPMAVTDEAPLRASLDQVVATYWGLTGADLAAAGPALDAWARALEPELVSAPRNLLGSFTLSEALRSANAQATAAEEVLRVLGADSDSRKLILNSNAFSVPRKVVVVGDGK
jgi:ferric-dicitrate binding protein FerR (iron transport regulator)